MNFQYNKYFADLIYENDSHSEQNFEFFSNLHDKYIYVNKDNANT